jgi:hypothetical protein
LQARWRFGAHGRHDGPVILLKYHVFFRQPDPIKVSASYERRCNHDLRDRRCGSRFHRL